MRGKKLADAILAELGTRWEKIGKNQENIGKNKRLTKRGAQMDVLWDVLSIRWFESQANWENTARGRYFGLPYAIQCILGCSWNVCLLPLEIAYVGFQPVASHFSHF